MDALIDRADVVAAAPNGAIAPDAAIADRPVVLAIADLHLTLTSAAGSVQVLRGISLEVAAGEKVAVIGPSGSGKSSLLAVAAGLEPASSGRVRLLGRELAGLSESALAQTRRGRVGIIFQDFHLLPNLTALGNVAAAIDLAGEKSGKAARHRAEEALRRVGLGARMDHYPTQLSGGERQRVAVARAAAIQPAILFADEPTGNLDSASGAIVEDLLFDLADEQAMALVLITHDARLAKRCDRVIRLRDGVRVDEAGEY